MPKSVCVLYSDIVGWSNQKVTEQIVSAQELFSLLVTLRKKYGLQEEWKTSTGDGFAIAFQQGVAFRVCLLARDLLRHYLKHRHLKLRLALAGGSIESFVNPLTGQKDWTGPAVVNARRILDGITAGNLLLVQKDLAGDVKKQDSELGKHVLPHPKITDKHGEEHEVCQVLESRSYPKRAGLPPSLNTLSQASKSREIARTEGNLKKKLSALDGLLVLWMDDQPTGLAATAVAVTPRLPVDPQQSSLEELPARFSNYAAPYLPEVKAKVGPTSNPKLWLKEFRSPFSDRPYLDLTVGKTDYHTAKALELAFDKGSLREEFESGHLDLAKDFPGMVGTHSFVITSDDHLILAQRKRGHVDFAGGAYSPSFEEQWNPAVDAAPFDAVLRGLSEEFHADPTHGIHVSADNVRLLAIVREWGVFWHIALEYMVRIPAPAERFLHWWDTMPYPKDRNEHMGVCAVPLVNQDARRYLLSLVDPTKEVSAEELRSICGKEGITGSLTDGPLHQTSGRARIMFALHALNYLGNS